MSASRPILALICGVLSLSLARAQENLLVNPGFEQVGKDGFCAGWGGGEFGSMGKTLFLDTEGAREGRHCLRMVGTPNTWTTCAGTPIPVKPNTAYWITWWFRAEQPLSSRTYLFLQTNTGQRVFPQTDRRGRFGWTRNIVRYVTRADETSLQPVLTMHSYEDPPGTAWWDEVGVWEKLPPDLQVHYRAQHPWDDVRVSTARSYARTPQCVVWGDRAEARLYPHTPVPAKAPRAPAIPLAAPGRGHDLYQLVVTPSAAMAPVSLRFTRPTGPGAMPAGTLRYRVARCVPVQEVRNPAVPLGPTPDPLVEPTEPEPVGPKQSALFWIEWAPPPGGKPGTYRANVEVLSGGKVIATVPLRLRRWGFDLPAVPHYRSMVLFGLGHAMRFYPGQSEEAVWRLGWEALSRHRLSGFNIALYPNATLQDGKLQIDWTRFDRMVAAAKEFGASAITLGPMLGGGASEGWKPWRFLGFMPLEDPGFDAVYVELNRQMAARLRQAGLLDRCYVYPYDEPEPDYMDKIARLCDLVHQGDPELKCLMTVDPASAEPLWGKVKAWIVPSWSFSGDVVAQRRAAGDEVWVYNMVASIEDPALAHRLYAWHALQVDARGGLLWNSTWWNQINPWENPTAVAVPVGRQHESLYRYRAGEASLFYPDPAGKGPLVPALRLPMIRQGVEDFDLLVELERAWREAAARLPAATRRQEVARRARAALMAPVVLDGATMTTCWARTEAVRHIAAAELEVARQRPAVIAHPTRLGAHLGVAGWAEPGTRLTLNGKSVPVGRDGRFQRRVTAAELAAGLQWAAAKSTARKSWQWAGLR